MPIDSFAWTQIPLPNGFHRITLEILQIRRRMRVVNERSTSVKVIASLILLVGLMFAGGCETAKGSGALAGGGIGTLIGAAAGDTQGAIIGAAIGTGVGYIIGDQVDE